MSLRALFGLASKRSRRSTRVQQPSRCRTTADRLRRLVHLRERSSATMLPVVRIEGRRPVCFGLETNRPKTRSPVPHACHVRRRARVSNGDSRTLATHLPGQAFALVAYQVMLPIFEAGHAGPIPSPAPPRKPRSSPMPPGSRMAVKKPFPFFVPAACPIGSRWLPFAEPRRTLLPWPPRSPHPVPWSRVDQGSAHVCCDPSASMSTRRLTPASAVSVLPA
jgi:hypothetical protein